MSIATATATAYRCCNDERLSAVRNRAGLNGIEAIELVVAPGPLTVLPTEIDVIFVKAVDDIPPVAAVRITGGSSGQGLTVVRVTPTHDPRTIRVEIDAPGDLTEYELSLIDPATLIGPPAGIDPVLGRCTFSFAVVCQTDVDCMRVPSCPPTALDEPRIDRLAKDYPGFRRLLLDRLAVALPEWRQRNPADVRVALVELLAYIGDQLSYEQDAVATEAYLGTARDRVSVRRHARLVDYRMHDGLSARAFLQLVIGGGAGTIADGRSQAAAGTFMTATADLTSPLDASTGAGQRDLHDRLRRGDRVFHVVTPPDPATTVAPAVFSADHNTMRFHTWSGDQCCLPSGAVRATLAGHLPGLAVDDVLILAEQRDPATGELADADPTRRHAIRLTAVAFGSDAQPLVDPATGDEITEIAWGEDDALPFTMIVSDADGHDDVSVTMGNIVLVEDGVRNDPEDLVVPIQDRPWRPRLAAVDLAQSAPIPSPGASAASMRAISPAEAAPVVTFTLGGSTWTPARDLIDVGDQLLMVPEIDNGGRTRLRFGVRESEGTFRHGRPPDPGAAATTGQALHRSGVGPGGNVGAGSIRRLVTTGQADQELGASLRADGVIVALTNPIPAWGGSAPEAIEEVRQRAPFAFNIQERAVTADDYARRAEQFRDSQGGGVQRAVAQLRWTGSWYTVFIAVDRIGGAPIDEAFESELVEYLHPYRMSGHDIEIEGAVDVPLEVRLEVTLSRATFRSVVMETITDRLSNRRLSNGSLGLFHPDRLTFAQTVHLSPIVAAAQAVAGVEGVRVVRFGPYRRPNIEARDVGLIEVGRNEIARLDNNPSRPDRGVLGINLVGGR